MNADGQKLLEAIQAKGSDADDLRDAAHEAHHALFVKLRKPWTRDNIHEALVKKARKIGSRLMNGELVGYELDARTVEWLVCERFGEPYEAEKWASMAWWETAKNMNIHCPSVEWILDAMTKRKTWGKIIRYAEAVSALVPLPKTLTVAEVQEAESPMPRCVSCGRPKAGHNYRHPFTPEASR